MAPVSLCGSPTLPVQVTSAAAFDLGCVFSVELSDASGSFAAPTVIVNFNAVCVLQPDSPYPVE